MPAVASLAKCIGGVTVPAIIVTYCYGSSIGLPREAPVFLGPTHAPKYVGYPGQRGD